MIENLEIQQEKLRMTKIKALLIYFIKYRKIKNRELARRLRYAENFLTNVRKDKELGGEKLLGKLEDFYVLDKVKEMSDIKRQISILESKLEYLEKSDVNIFYGLRHIGASFPPMDTQEIELCQRFNEEFLPDSGEISRPIPDINKWIAAEKEKIKAGGGVNPNAKTAEEISYSNRAAAEKKVAREFDALARRTLSKKSRGDSK